MLGITSYNSSITSNLQRTQKKTQANQPYASLTSPKDSIHFSGIFFSKEKREDTGKTVAQIQNTAEAGAEVAGKTTVVAAGSGLAAAALPVVALNYLLGGAQRGSNESFVHTMTEEESNDYKRDADYNNGIGWCP
jgi:hypothetical protein